MTSIAGAVGGATDTDRTGTCRAWILRAMEVLEGEHGHDAFSLAEILAKTQGMGAPYTAATIKANIVSSMCIEARAHRTVYSDLERVRRGHYRRLRPQG